MGSIAQAEAELRAASAERRLSIMTADSAENKAVGLKLRAELENADHERHKVENTKCKIPKCKMTER